MAAARGLRPHARARAGARGPRTRSRARSRAPAARAAGRSGRRARGREARGRAPRRAAPAAPARGRRISRTYDAVDVVRAHAPALMARLGAHTGPGADHTARLLIACPDGPGIVAAVSRFLFEQGANIVSSDQHSTGPQHGSFFM